MFLVRWKVAFYPFYGSIAPNLSTVVAGLHLGTVGNLDYRPYDIVFPSLPMFVQFSSCPRAARSRSSPHCAVFVRVTSL